VILLAEEVNELWKWPNFLILAVLLGYLIRKNGAPLLEARSQGIREGLEAGEKAKAEAEARAAGVQAKIANLDREIAALRSIAMADLEREADRIRREAEAEMSRIEHHTALEIVSIGKHARVELRHYAAKLAMDLAEQKIRSRMSPDAQQTLLHNFAGDISGYTAGSGASQTAPGRNITR
jgi:F0F1-type ATP synthase membrane subunit b/b'